MVAFDATSESEKVTVDESGIANWETSDRLAVWGDTDGDSPYSFSVKEILEKKAVFHGLVQDSPERSAIYALYPFGDYVSEDELAKSSVATAAFKSTWDPTAVRIALPETQENGAVYALMAGKGNVFGNDFSGCTVSMNHLSCIWDFILSNPEGRNVESVSLKTSSSLFPCAATIDLTSDTPEEMKVTEWSDRLTVQLGEDTHDATICARFYLLPLVSRKVDRFDIEICYTEGDTEVFTKSWPGASTVPGHKYTTSLTLGKSRPPVVPAPELPSLDEMVIYCASPRSFASSASLNAVLAQLDAIKALGCNVIWLLPIYDQSNVRQPYGSPYSSKDLYTIDEEYGTLSSLCHLVDAAHEKGMSIILDFITRQTGADCSWLTEHPSWYAEAYSPDYTGAALFNWPAACDELRPEFLAMMRYWIDHANVDGYRCDSAIPGEPETGIRVEDWNWMISRLRESYPDRNLLLLAESPQASTLSAGFDLNYGWHFCDALEKVFEGTKPSTLLFKTDIEEMESAAAAGPDKARMRFSTNQDRSARSSPLQTYTSRKGAMAAAALAWTLGGVPQIYSSQEIAYPTPVSIFKGVATVKNWTSAASIREECTKLLALSKRPALRKGTTTQLCASAVVGYLRSYDDDEVLVLVNTTNAAAEIPLDTSYLSASYTDLYTGAPFTFSGNTLKAYQYLILQK
ncbi:MAG: alpha-glucosidase C-terminal domain-containing protein [Bacteroidales bacterium]|nr:alpha-glucosidase C-terminal domain-containing protein [Bacteroidales bacterium]